MVAIIMLLSDLHSLINGMLLFLENPKRNRYDNLIATSMCFHIYSDDHFRFFLTRFKFDDERVTKEDAKRALEEQYGGEEEVCTMLLLQNSI